MRPRNIVHKVVHRCRLRSSPRWRRRANIAETDLVCRSVAYLLTGESGPAIRQIINYVIVRRPGVRNRQPLWMIPHRWGRHIRKLRRLTDDVVLVISAYKKLLPVGQLKVKLTNESVVIGGSVGIETKAARVRTVAGSRVICHILVGCGLYDPECGRANARTHTIGGQVSSVDLRRSQTVEPSRSTCRTTWIARAISVLVPNNSLS